MNYYKSEVLNESLIRITDSTDVCCYLVVGQKKACLLDTCCGYGNIKEYAETLTNKPIFVILSHGHYDHMGGAALFDEVYMNHNDLPVFQSHLNIKFKTDIPEGVSQKDNIPIREAPMLDIKDYQVFDLGNLHVKMIPVKGHTPGMMCPLIVEQRIIIFGDACGVSVLLFDENSSNVSEYRESLINLKKYEGEYDTIYRNHGTFFSNKILLDNVIECCDLILSGKDDHIPSKFNEYNLFAAKETQWPHGRKDGKEGNILYSIDKAK
ncbi:MAG: MBL fold metallo-hydrolase [Coprobacillus sp.]